MPKIHKYNYTHETPDASETTSGVVELCFCYTVRGKKLTLVNIEVEDFDIRGNTFWRGCTWKEFDDFEQLISDEVELEMVKRTGVKPSEAKKPPLGGRKAASSSLHEEDSDDNPEGLEQ